MNKKKSLIGSVLLLFGISSLFLFYSYKVAGESEGDSSDTPLANLLTSTNGENIEVLVYTDLAITQVSDIYK
jgi:hypothetical protein